MNHSLTQLNAILKPYHCIYSKSKQAVYSLFFFFCMLSLNIAWAQGDCPEGDPLQWDWMQDVIESADFCTSGLIGQFEYEGETYFEVSGPNCNLVDHSIIYYDCKGDIFCFGGGWFDSCETEFRQAAWNNTNIWTYELPITQTCPDGEPEQWDWVQEMLDNMSACGETEVVHIQNEYFTLIHFWNACNSFKKQFYDCQGNSICGYGSDPSLFWVCDVLINVMEDYTPSFCPEGDDPLEWDWIRDLIIEYSDCEIREIRQFEYNGKTYFKTIAKEPDFYDFPCDDFSLAYFNCAGRLICDNYSEPECNPEMVAASNTYESIWFYRDGIPTATCPEGDPLQWDWIQDIIAQGDECNIGTIRQFDYDGDTYYQVRGEEHCSYSHYDTYYYNCTGELICDNIGFSNSCDQNFSAAINNGTVLWSYTQITKNCPEGYHGQWDWVQEMKNNLNGCGETTVVHLEDYEMNTFIHFWNECDSMKNRFYDCQGDLICGGESDLYVRLCDMISQVMEDYTPIVCPEGDPLQWDWLREKLDNSGCEIKEIRQFEYHGSINIGILDNNECIQDGGLAYYDCFGNLVCANNLWFDTCDPYLELAANAATTIYTNPFDAIIYPEKTHTICVPVSLPPLLTVEDFGTTGDQNFLNTLTVEFVEEQIDVQQYFTSTNRLYLLSSSTGNYTYFSTIYHVANQILETPYVSPSGTICEEDLWSHIKIGRDQYKIYADQNGTKGSILSTCNTPSLVCSTANFGVDTKVSGEYNFWATTYFEFPDGSICESEAAPFYVDVEAKPTATLSTQNKTLNIGEGLSLIDIVSDNKSGYWSGENIIYLMAVTGENIAYFSANEAGTYKLYYTVKNDNCEQSYLLVVEVVSAGKATVAQASNKPINAVFNMYPNPTTNKIFIDLYVEAVYQINLINISGKVIKQLKTEMNTTVVEMDVSDLPKGMYLVELKNKMNTQLQKFIIK